MALIEQPGAGQFKDIAEKVADQFGVLHAFFDLAAKCRIVLPRICRDGNASS